MISKKQGARGDLNTTIILGIKIPIPSLQEQNRIVTILDTFEASIANLEQQLTHRQKQYEYYRNMLLTFDE
jgi:type I restriction enzyme S subunit